ncbi:MAG TPA: peptidoglycan-binding protein [Alphaproteobacteria bacterium]|nr:peptidoglycan-binding protein [Alphaproteobacteria bacterium]HNS43703.1 peptidoglycan-binding protein [Alphaproteobacteria bacterium]
MDDITGKKFSLQDWVTRRAANQSGGVAARGAAVEPLSIKKAVNGDDVHEIVQDESVTITTVSVEETAPAATEAESKSSHAEVLAKDVLSKVEARAANPVQQLQIVRLLSDLGERLRQSEKEREILWKEIEVCRKQIDGLESKNSESKKAYLSLEEAAAGKEDFIKGLLDKQAELETLLKSQNEALAQNKSENEKFEERLDQKLSGIETATGSAIVRIEDALAENNKLSKRIEQLSQDKARLNHKLEVMEETLKQTQETLKAKALVLLTDQALAAKTSAPQVQAWTGDDTLRMSKIGEGSAVPSNGPVSDIAASIKQGKKEKTSDMNNTAFLAALVVLGIAGGVLLSQINFKSLPSVSWSKESGAKAVEVPAAADSAQDEQLEPADQDVLMSDIAKLANQIEPATRAEEKPDAADLSVPHDDVEISEFDKAIDAEDQALERFQAEKPAGELSARIKPDKALPKSVREIEAKAFDGNAASQHDLAAIYTAGHMGVKVNYERAAKWFTEAAYQNVANAQYNLGVLYHQGLGVAKNVGKAIDLYRVAAANGHPEAEYNLAIAYIEGVGSEYNPQIAAVYFQKSASGGVVEAAYNLGLLHENGLLGESQPDEAVFWYTLAANKGDEQAKAALKQIKTQLSMSDEDAERIVERIAKTKPGFVNDAGKAALPDPVKLPAVSSDEKSAGGSALIKELAIDPMTVSQIQEQLIRLGLYKGMPNGEMSSSVTEAIKTYQAQHGLKMDGFPTDTLLVYILTNESEPAAGTE